MDTQILAEDKLYFELEKQYNNYNDFFTAKRISLIGQNNFYKDTFSMPKRRKIINLPRHRNGLKVLEPASAFEQNFYCYPIKENIMTDSKFILPYYDRYPTFSLFNSAMTKIHNQIALAYHFYPTEPEDSQLFENKMFFIWAFIKTVLLIRSLSPNYIFNADHYYEIINIFCDILHKQPKYFYRVMSEYTHAVQHWLKLRQVKPSRISQYRKAYCQICNMYLCRVHFYNHKEELQLQDIRVVKTTPKKLSGHKNYIYCMPCINSSKSNTSNRTITGEAVFKCDNELDSCKHNMAMSFYNNNNSEIEENHFEIFKSIDKTHFYILNCLLSSELTGQSCVMRKLFNNKYKCSMLEKIIRLCRDSNNNKEIDRYLAYGKQGQVSLPIMSIERRSNDNDSDAFMQDIRSNEDISMLIQPQKSKQRLDYIPCDHVGRCTLSNCLCKSTRGYCEKFCICYKKGCHFAFPGCKCVDGCGIKTESEEISKCICIREERECDPEICGRCTRDCCNTAIANKKYKKTTVSQSIVANAAGLFAYEDIDEFELIDEYLGEIVIKDEFERRSIVDKRFERSYGFAMTEVFDIDALRAGNVLRYVNHGDFGWDNCYARAKFVRGVTRIVLYSKKKIKKGQELLFHYHIQNCSWMNKYNKTFCNGPPNNK